jgi:hypothetical protein
MRLLFPSRLVAPLLLGLAAVLAAPGAVRAAPPEVVAVDDAFVDEFLTEACGFEVLHTVEGTITTTLAEDGSPALQRFRLTETLVGPTGATLRTVNVGIDKTLSVVQDAAGNTVVTLMATGVLGYHFQVPGEGVVAGNAGREIRRITFDAEGNFVDFAVVEDAGLSRDIDEAAVAAICASLAG